MTKPSIDDCIRAVAAVVMALQESGATQEDIVQALMSAARCEQYIRAHTLGE
jgi:alkylhydroperoxidase/carboxymuconolactone decarboxylase family protein YurZ